MVNSLIEEVTEDFKQKQKTEVNWKPFPGAQERFLKSDAFEVLFGGAAGPGKTECLVMDALRQSYHPRYRGVLFRRTMTELADADGPIQRSHQWYPHVGGVWKEGKKKWVFPSGAEIYFHHMEHPLDRYKYQSSQYQFIGFDELTHFEEVQYIYLFSRCRTTRGSGLKTYIRAATNPGGNGHFWVKERFISRGIANTIGWFKRINDKDISVPAGTPGAKTRSFIPATVKDNPMITDEYIDNLLAMNPVERDRLLNGDWDAEYKGRVYDNFTDGNISTEADYDPRYPVEWWIDDGYHYPRAILLVQERPFNGIPDCLCVFHEHYVVNELAEDSFQQVLMLPYPEPEYAIYDPNALELGTRLGDIGITAISGYNNVQEGIKGVRRYICDSNGVRSLIFHPRVENTIREMRKYSFMTNTEQKGEPPPQKKDDHAVDAIRYGIATSRMWQWEQ